MKPVGSGAVDPDEFAALHSLRMVVCERPRSHWAYRESNRYYASFDRVEIKEGGMLRGSYGDGATPEEAIENYLGEIRGRRLVFAAYSDCRREIDVPNEFTKAES